MSPADVLAARLDRLLGAARAAPSTSLDTPAALRGMAFDAADLGVKVPTVTLRAAVPDVATVGEALAEIIAAREELLEAALASVAVGAELGAVLTPSWLPEDAARLAELWPFPDDSRAGVLATLAGWALSDGGGPPAARPPAGWWVARFGQPFGMFLDMNGSGALVIRPGWFGIVSPGHPPAPGREGFTFGVNAPAPCRPARFPPGASLALFLVATAAQLRRPGPAWAVALARAAQLSDDDRHGIRLASVRRAVELDLGADGERAPLARAALDLEAKLAGWAHELAGVARELAELLPPLPAPQGDPGPEAGLEAARAADRELLAWLEARGGEVSGLRTKAARRHQEGRDPWAWWLPASPWWALGWGAPPEALDLAARVLWLARWAPELASERERERERARERTPAYAVPVADALARAFSTSKIEGSRLISRAGGELAVLTPARAQSALVSSASELVSVDAHRFLWWFLSTVAEREAEGVRDFRVIRVEGGFAGLEARIRAFDGRGKLERAVLASVVPTLARLPIPGPNDRSPDGNLYAYNPGEPATGGARAWFDLTAGTMLHRAAVRERVSWDRDTMPIPGLPPLRGVATRGNEHGRLATLRLLTVRRLALAGAELVTRGGARITDGDWFGDLLAVGLPEPLAGRWERVRDGWLTDGDDAPAFLVRGDGPDRYHLHPEHHIGARAYLDRGAELAAKGEERAARRKRRE